MLDKRGNGTRGCGSWLGFSESRDLGEFGESVQVITSNHQQPGFLVYSDGLSLERRARGVSCAQVCAGPWLRQDPGAVP